MSILRISTAVSVIAALLLICGCSSITFPPPPPEPQQSESSPQLQETVAKLNVQLQTNSAAKLDTAEFEQMVRGQLANAGFASLPGEPTDLRLNITLESELFDQSGNYYVYNGRAVAELWRRLDGKQLVGNSFAAKSERKLGEREAAINLQERLVTALKDWITAQITPDRVGVAASEITLSLSKFKIFKGGDQKQISEFIESTQGIPGVHSCRLVENNATDRVYRFRVIYFPEKLPMGLGNAVAKACGYRTR